MFPSIVTKWSKETKASSTQPLSSETSRRSLNEVAVPDSRTNRSQSSDTTGSTTSASSTMSSNSLAAVPDSLINSSQLIKDMSFLIDESILDDEIYAHIDASMDTQPIDSEVEKEEMMFRQRQEILYRLFSSETEFIAHLQAILKYFKRPMVTLVQELQDNKFFTNSTQITIDDVERVFGNMEDLLSLSLRFMKDMKKRFEIWGPVQLFSDIIQAMLQDLPACYTTFFENFPTILPVLERIHRSVQLKHTLSATVEDLGQDFHLMTLLEKPLEAVSRYAESISALTQYTGISHPDRDALQQCASRMRFIHSSTTANVKRNRNMSELFSMSVQIRNCPILFDQRREYIMQGYLDTIHERRLYVLLSDTILVAKGDQSYVSCIDLSRSTLVDLVEEGCFELLVSPDPSFRLSSAMPAMTYRLHASSGKEHALWVQEIGEAIEKEKDRNDVVTIK